MLKNVGTPRVVYVPSDSVLSADPRPSTSSPNPLKPPKESLSNKKIGACEKVTVVLMTLQTYKHFKIYLIRLLFVLRAQSQLVSLGTMKQNTEEAMALQKMESEEDPPANDKPNLTTALDGT
ncbi:hypothetical protein J6590_015063 [Homalodisca vitripennis]|nr:hypothetical protein J6590_015063 [Homalodisca vitripennis]